MQSTSHASPFRYLCCSFPLPFCTIKMFNQNEKKKRKRSSLLFNVCLILGCISWLYHPSILMEKNWNLFPVLGCSRLHTELLLAARGCVTVSPFPGRALCPCCVQGGLCRWSCGICWINGCLQIQGTWLGCFYQIHPSACIINTGGIVLCRKHWARTESPAG